jgi:hypothetical protein
LCDKLSYATPCTIIQQGQYLLFQGTAPIGSNTIPTPEAFSFPLLQAYVSSLASQAWVFENIQIQGDLASLAQSIRQGTCACITDGSFKDSHGTAAWKILDFATPEHVMEGQVVTPGHPYQQDAYCSELSGLYASVIAINAISKYFQIDGGTVTLSCDNMSATRMALYNDALGTNPSSCVAKIHWANTNSLQNEDRLHAIEGQPWSVSLGGHKVANNLSEQCKDCCQRPRIQTYWIEKGRFQPEDLNRIDYAMAGAALRSERPHTRRWVAKILSGYCGVNKWMNRWKQRESAACPLCAELLEDVQHVWLCQGMESPKKWEEGLKSLALEMRRLKTNPNLATMIIE